MRYRTAAAVLAFAFSTVALSGQSQASLISFTDVYTPGPIGVSVTGASPYSWLHDINDSINIAQAIIKTATLSVVLSDPQGGNEKVVLNFDGITDYFNNVANSGKSYSYDYQFNTIEITSFLQSDGFLNVTLSLIKKDSSVPNVTFMGATLSGTAKIVPEPGSLPLIGGALVGICLLRRRM